MPTLKEFALLIQSMRTAQLTYLAASQSFSMRTQADLETVKRLERDVDRTVKQILDHRETTQVQLFPEEPRA